MHKNSRPIAGSRRSKCPFNYGYFICPVFPAAQCFRGHLEKAAGSAFNKPLVAKHYYGYIPGARSWQDAGLCGCSNGDAAPGKEEGCNLPERMPSSIGRRRISPPRSPRLADSRSSVIRRLEFPDSEMRPVPSEYKTIRSTVEGLEQRERQSDAQRDSQRRFYALLKKCKAKELFIYNNRIYGLFQANATSIPRKKLN
uniref:Uncharacterized protein n=1 Tax=Anopheles atroparvus TaxID=41427 RepID=A0A182IKJ2_ANOAO